MENKKEEFQKEEMSGAILLQKIKSGEINPRALKAEERQVCVDILILEEGLKKTQVAQLLCCTERTIRRDIDTINEKNRQKPSLELAEKLIGKMLVRAEIHISHLMRLARSKDGSPAERAQAEYMAWKIRVDLMGRLQTLGYLPLKPQAIVGDVFHHVDGKISDLDKLTKEIIDIEKMADGDGKVDESIKKDLSQMKTVLDKIRSSEEPKNQEVSNEDTRK